MRCPVVLWRGVRRRRGGGSRGGARFRAWAWSGGGIWAWSGGGSWGGRWRGRRGWRSPFDIHRQSLALGAVRTHAAREVQGRARLKVLLRYSVQILVLRRSRQHLVGVHVRAAEASASRGLDHVVNAAPLEVQLVTHFGSIVTVARGGPGEGARGGADLNSLGTGRPRERSEGDEGDENNTSHGRSRSRSPTPGTRSRFWLWPRRFERRTADVPDCGQDCGLCDLRISGEIDPTFLEILEKRRGHACDSSR